MKNANWWQNALGETITAALVMGALWVISYVASEPVPMWAWYLAAYIGVHRWNTVTFKDLP